MDKPDTPPPPAGHLGRARDRTQAPAPLAPRAAGNEPDCAAERATAGGRLTCLAARGHAGDHVPYGGARDDEEMRRYTWPQDPGAAPPGAGPDSRVAAPAPVNRELSTDCCPGYATELDGTETDGRANLAEARRVPTYTCPDCGGTGTEPTHWPPCWRLYIGSRLRTAPAVTEARAALAAYDELAAMSRLSSYDSARFLAAQALLSHQLRAVLAAVDEQAGATS